MLQSLHIRNLALLEEVSLDFEPGFTAVTGETGAGKSILLGALSLLAGGRADKSVIRQGASACEVEAALFFPDPRRIDAVLALSELPACEGGVLLLRRSLPSDKPPRITVNGSLATLASLQRLGELWIDFHGPSEPRRLLKEGCQLELLDLYARSEAVLDLYRREYGAWRQAVAERDRLAAESALSPDQVEFLRHRLQQFAAVDLSDEGIEALERDFQRMSRSQELIELASAVAAGLSGDEGLQGRMAGVIRDARRLAELNPSSRALSDRLAASAVELHDLAGEFAALERDLQFDPEAAEDLGKRMAGWLDLKRKHGGDARSVRAARDEAVRRVEVQKDFSGAMGKAEGRIVECERAARVSAAALRSRREKAARELAKATGREILQLGFAKAGFQVAVPLSDELGPRGDSGCEFLFAPNVGEEPRPLQRIASSGELARVMLALKAVLADLDGVPLLVFDEVDANVGGEIGRVVGEKMAAIGRTRQVLCVTHLPQVAAQAASHLVVTKDQAGARATVAITAIEKQRKARVSELARMLGDRNAKSALAHAEELLG